jgi:hypothetical protein
MNPLPQTIKSIFFLMRDFKPKVFIRETNRIVHTTPCIDPASKKKSKKAAGRGFFLHLPA